MKNEPVVAASSFAENVQQLIDKVEYRPIQTDADLDAVLKLRYAAYLREGALTPHQSGRLPDCFDRLDNVVNVGIFYEDRLVAAKRFHFLSRPEDDSPTMEVFSDVLQPLLEAGKRLVDPNRFLVDYDAARQLPHLAYATLRLSVIASAYYAAHLTTISVRAEHGPFYRRSFFAEPSVEPRCYPLLTKKIGLLLVNYERDQNRIVERSPFYASSPAEQEYLFGRIKREAPLSAAA